MTNFQNPKKKVEQGKPVVIATGWENDGVKGEKLSQEAELEVKSSPDDIAEMMRRMDEADPLLRHLFLAEEI